MVVAAKRPILLSGCCHVADCCPAKEHPSCTERQLGGTRLFGLGLLAPRFGRRLERGLEAHKNPATQLPRRKYCRKSYEDLQHSVVSACVSHHGK